MRQVERGTGMVRDGGSGFGYKFWGYGSFWGRLQVQDSEIVAGVQGRGYGVGSVMWV